MDVDLGLFEPGSASIYSNYWMAGSATPAGHEAISVTVPETGDYYIHVNAWYGSGPYALRWSLGDAAQTEIQSSVDTTKPAYGKALTFSGVVTDPGRRRRARRRPSRAGHCSATWRMTSGATMGGRRWTWVSPTRSGAVALTGTSDKAAIWRLVTVDGWDVAALGSEIETKPRVQMTRPSPSSRTLRAGRTYTWRGIMRPVHLEDGANIKLRFFRLVRGKWTLYREVGARNYNPYGDPEWGFDIAFDDFGRIIKPYT